MISFFGEADLKTAVVARVREHQRLDQIIQGTYWNGSQGCGIGCVLHSGEHMAVERQLGLPVFWAYMNEHIFESLPSEKAKTWPLRLMEATPVGVTLDLVYPKFMRWLLSDPQGVRLYANTATLRIMDLLIKMYDRRINGEKFDRQEAESAAESAESAAWSARSAAWSAESAARSAAWSAESAAWSAESAARSAAGSAGSAARSAAWSAESAARSAGSAAGMADWSARRYNFIDRQADYFIQLLTEHAGSAVAPLATTLSVEERHPWLVVKR